MLIGIATAVLDSSLFRWALGALVVGIIAEAFWWRSTRKARQQGATEQLARDAQERGKANAAANQARADVAGLGDGTAAEQLRKQFGRGE